MKSGPIIIIDDDTDDREILEGIFAELKIKNKLIWFHRAIEVFDYLLNMPGTPFLILCDVNLPAENGIELKGRIDDNPELRKKSIPFVFYSASVDQEIVEEAYTAISVQGFFLKGSTIEEIKKQIKIITDYWRICRHPNS
jgi:CheY-like chemotaxis protein